MQSRPVRLGTLVVVCGLVCTAPALAVEALNWGGGVYSAYGVPYADYGLDNVWHFDVTLTLEAGSYITALPGEEQATPSREWRFTGMRWQPDGGDLVNRFMEGSFSGAYWSEGEAAQTLPAGDWVHGSGPTYGQQGDDGFVGIFVDDDGPKYDVVAGDPTEFSKGLLIWDPDDAAGSTKTTYVNFAVDVLIPQGIGEQNMQMGWTGYGSESSGFTTGYKRAQTSEYLTPELPPSALLGLSMFPLGIAYLRGRRRKDD